jgi:hypothetical protein
MGVTFKITGFLDLRRPNIRNHHYFIASPLVYMFKPSGSVFTPVMELENNGSRSGFHYSPVSFDIFGYFYQGTAGLSYNRTAHQVEKLGERGTQLCFQLNWKLKIKNEIQHLIYLSNLLWITSMINSVTREQATQLSRVTIPGRFEN